MQALLIVAHGSRVKAAARALESLAGRVQATLGASVLVRHAHMTLGAPSVEEAFVACVEAGARDIIVHPFMLSAGKHATEDLPRLLAAAARPHPEVTFSITPPLGAHPDLAALVLDLCEL